MTASAAPTTAVATAGTAPAREWKDALASCAKPHLGRSLLDIATSLVPYLALSVLMYFSIGISWALTLALAVPTAGFAVRTFILFHDCTHGSFLPWRRANAWLGAGLGVVLHTPFVAWRHSHAIHHATSGDLDRRGGGDVWTVTVAEYAAMSRGERFKYRAFRNPLVMLGLGPILAMIIAPRFVSWSARPRMRRSVIGTDIALIVLVGALCWWIGWADYLLIWGPTVWIAGATGIWLFYVQHQFEDAYWESDKGWNYADAALRGSSHLKLPKVLQFFTGNIGLHHVHHLNARIPNYNLQRAHDQNPVFHSVPTLSLRDGMRALRLKLWDENRGRMVSFAEAAAPVGA
jgi:omega-6 fatty acid desaturase (delta-12 desaturase)